MSNVLKNVSKTTFIAQFDVMSGIHNSELAEIELKLLLSRKSTISMICLNRAHFMVEKSGFSIQHKRIQFYDFSNLIFCSSAAFDDYLHSLLWIVLYV